MGATAGKIDKGLLIKWCITFGLGLIFFLIPETDFYTFQLKMFFVTTVMALAIMAMELLDTMLIALLLPGVWVLFKVASTATIFQPWLTPSIFMTIGSFALAEILDHTGVLNRIGYWLMSKVGGSYPKLMFSLFGVGMVLSILTFGAAYTLFAALCLGLCRALGIMGTRMAAAIAMVCMLSTCSAKCVIYSPGMYATLLAAAGNMVTLDITFVDAYLHNFPMIIVSLIMVVVTFKWYKADNSMTDKGQAYFQGELEKMGPMSIEEKKGLAVLLLLIVYLVTVPITGFDTSAGFMVFPFLMVLPGIAAAPASCLKNMKFDMIFFIATCLSIGSVAGSFGLANVFSDIVTPVFAQLDSPIFIFGFLFVLVFFLNFILTPMAIWALITAPILAIALDLGMQPEPFIYALLHCAEAVIFPYEYGSYLTVFAFGMISMKDFVKLNSVRCVIYTAGFMLLLVPWWMFLGILY